MRKLLTILNATLRDSALWDPAKHLQSPRAASLGTQLLR
jgi:hypothetical protein